MTRPRVYVRDETRATIGELSTWSELTMVMRRNDPGRWTLVTSSPTDADLLSPPMDNNGVIGGARGVIIRVDDDNGDQLTVMSGWLEGHLVEKNDGTSTTWEVSGFDDTVILADSQAWPRPHLPIEDQGDRDDVRRGQASDRIRAYALENISKRLNIPGFGTGSEWHRLGPDGTSRARFTNILELCKEIAGTDVNFRVIQQDAPGRTLMLEQWVPADKRIEVQFSPELATVTGWEHTYEPAESSRVVFAIGGGGEDEPRVFREYSGHITEQELGGVRKIETFEDSSDIQTTDEDGDPVDWADEAMEAAIQYLEERRLRSSFKFTLTGGPRMRAGVNYAPGDLVRAYKTITPSGDPVGLVEDLIEEINTTWNAEGETSEVRIGGEDGFSFRTERKLRLALRRIRFLERYK